MPRIVLLISLALLTPLMGSCQGHGEGEVMRQGASVNQNMPALTWKDVIHFAEKGSPPPDRRVVMSDTEWRQQLSPEEFRITRLKGTERAFTGQYCESHAPGVYACRCCGTELFDSREKFESGTGWPSFTQPVRDNVVKYEKDTSFGMVRVEILCNVCDAHLGHVFPDGPGPGGLRFCTNSASLVRTGE
ncbi:MAG TPA: peptide-methionine (R)-S-oxide reductase MsrB [Bacteroidales bacterium]|nr:peptide-methionine (R)-S-oxide reductase MsrB [Bacteroidales bacterium]HRZ78197.1 peptide-methionine (R)-S-oxide reductase MsrB [Bacteroidales bacterium]